MNSGIARFIFVIGILVVIISIITFAMGIFVESGSTLLVGIIGIIAGLLLLGFSELIFQVTEIKNLLIIQDRRNTKDNEVSEVKIY